MKKNQLFAACLFAATCVSSAVAQNTPAATAKVPAKGTANARLQAIEMAGNLVQYGIAKKQPLLLVSAAQILVDNPIAGAVKMEKEEQTKEKEAPAAATTTVKKTGQEVALTPKDVLAKAKELANGDATVLAAIQKVEAAAAKERFGGAAGGAVYTTRRINADSRYSFTCTYVGGRYAELRLSGDGDSDLDFYVFDNNGNLVGSDEDGTDRAYFSWYPPYTMTYRVVVVNRGSVYNVLSILTN